MFRLNFLIGIMDVSAQKSYFRKVTDPRTPVLVGRAREGGPEICFIMNLPGGKNNNCNVAKGGFDLQVGGIENIYDRIHLLSLN